MKRDIDMNEISDGKLYTANDMVKADCGDCVGCSACCQGMGTSILLDPRDIFMLTTNLGVTFEQLLVEAVELNMIDGIILPNLKMSVEKDSCIFLNDEGRCQIHAFRPGICRLFPLGRFYENRSFQYFLQIHECKKENKTKVKVKKWIDTPDLKKYEQFIINWHYFISDIQQIVSQIDDDALIKKVNMFILQQFFLEAYHAELDFYEQFAERLSKAKTVIATITNTKTE